MTPIPPLTLLLSLNHFLVSFFFCRVNVTLGPREDRVLMTGLHTVCDISCSQCSTVIGWKYEVAFEESQKYKEGKFIIEKVRIIKEGSW
jgi:hypothetical protein